MTSRRRNAQVPSIERYASMLVNDTPQTIEIPLTQGQVTVVSLVDADLAQHKWCAAFCPQYANGGGYWAVRANYNPDTKTTRHTCLHRVILSRMLSRPLKRNEHVDHINMDTLDNCRSNLRLATNSQNCMNRRKRSDNTSGFKGVAPHGKKWRAYINKDGKRTNIGTFATPELAFAARCTAAKILHGEFANLG